MCICCCCWCVCVFSVCDIHLKIPLDATPITTRRSRGTSSSSRCEANLISGSVKHTNCSWQSDDSTGEWGRGAGSRLSCGYNSLNREEHSQRTRSALEVALEQLRGNFVLKMSFACPPATLTTLATRDQLPYNSAFLTHHFWHPLPPPHKLVKLGRNQRSRPLNCFVIR